ncbi:MAG: GlsB/YeaQ/YmgE family stress response membrane protein [Acidobacteria bacterium]|nr:GlsB/YeaQ/YmgE family stress response membrane protein [Acidobacteriota bacterium]
MSIITWIVLGLIAGFITSKLINKTGEGLVMDVVLGICGAVVGGEIFNRLGMTGVTGFNIWSLLVAVSGAALLLIGYHALQGTLKRAG